MLTGGCSRERVGSLLSGDTVTESLTNTGRAVLVIDIATPSFTDDVRRIDVAFLAIHGCHGEDGKLQGFLETVGIAYTGSGVLASALAMHKPTAKTVVQAAGVLVLPGISIERSRGPDRDARAILAEIALPVMVKPASEGGSVGMAVAHSVGELEALLAAAAASDVEVLAEPFIAGARSVTVGLLEIGGELTALPVLETVATEGEFYDSAAKRDPALRTYHCPADLPAQVTALLANAAITAHRALGCDGYSRSDFVVTPAGVAYWLEVNALPGLSRAGNLATMAAAAGIRYDELVTHILATAKRRRRYTP